MAKNTAPVNNQNADTEYGEEEQITFPPYWKPVVGQMYKVNVMGLDTRDEEFHRWVMQNADEKAIPCQEGPAKSNVSVNVESGKFFTTSVYVGLPLSLYVQLPDPIIIEVKGTRPVSNSKNNDMFVFGIRVTNRSKQLVNSRMAEMGDRLPASMQRLSPAAS